MGIPCSCSPHRDIGVAELGPAIEVQEAVDTADLASHEPFTLGQVQGVGCMEVIDGRHHGEVWKGSKREEWKYMDRNENGGFTHPWQS